MAAASAPLSLQLTPPFLAVPGLANFRDLGGYASAAYPGKAVRRGVVFRSTEPSLLVDEGIQMLQDLKITDVYDLRSIVEVDNHVHREGGRIVEWDGAKRHMVPILLDGEDYTPEAVALRWTRFAHGGTAGFVAVYERILELGTRPDHPFKPFHAILEHIAGNGEGEQASSPPTPLLVHCSAGKDRTGVICALVMTLCGVADEIVAHEYSLTEAGLGHRKEEFVLGLIQSGSLKDDRAGAERMVSAKKESMLGTLALLREKYGSVEKYLTDHCDIPPETVERVRKNLLVDIDADGQGELVDWESHAKMMAAVA